jgi:cell division protein FtsB
MSSKARIAVASVVFVGFLFGAVFPTRTYLAQRGEIAAATERLELFAEQNRRLEAEVRRLQNDEEIERIARARYNLVKPGEEAYAIVPVPRTGEAPPPPAAERPLPSRERPHPLVAWLGATLERVF